MKPVRLEEIARLERYAELRPAYRDALIRHKQARRLPVGDRVTLVFEDHETLRFQIQEMCWIERISDPDRVQAEIDVYNELMPGDWELSATLFIEITDAPEIRPELDRLVGIDEHVALVVGHGGAERVFPARFDAKQMQEERISAVQYIRFALDEGAAAALADPALPARLRIDHPHYACEAALPSELRRNLCSDLAGGADSLLPLAGADAVGGARDEVIEDDGRVRVLRPARERAPGHRIVEPVDAKSSLFEADPALLAALLAAVKRTAADVVRSHGACRVFTDVGPAAGRPRWHVLARSEPPA